LCKRNSEFEAENNHLKSELATSAREKKRLNDEVQQLKQIVHGHMEAKNQYVTQIDQLRSDKKELESEVSLIESILEDYKEKTRRLEKEKKRLKNKMLKVLMENESDDDAADNP